MTHQLRVVVSCPSLDLTLDGFSNSFAFETSETPPYSGIGPLFTALQNFYNVASGANSIASRLAPSLDNGAGHASIKAYDITGHLNGSPHGAPVAATTFTLASPGSAAGGTCVPEGVAAVLSFRSDYGTDVEFGPHTRPRARDRNRIYIGPLGQPALAYDSPTNRVKLATQYVSDVLASAFALSGTITSGGDTYNWRAWSRVAAAVKLITELWLDNRPDYQRRRSDPAPGTRTFRASAAV